jgi:UDP-N-acetylmuramoyl-L-alanyl-D-glutamate--2,6-diaminopimelate ligase
MKLKDVIKGVELVKSGNGTNREISGIFYNSQKVLPDGLFVAIRGTNTDGHSYIQEAVSRGAAVIVTERRNVIVPPGIVHIIVQDSRKALARISANFYHNPSGIMKVFGVTGTKGKTSTSIMLKEIFKTAGFKVGLIGTINYEIGERIVPSTNTTPETADIQQMLSEMVDKQIGHAVIEVSSHALDQGRVEGIEFDGGIFTNIAAHEHLDYHKTFRAYLAAKLKFVQQYIALSQKKNKYLIVNADDPYAGVFVKTARAAKIPCVSYGIRRKADFMPERFSYSVDGLRFELAGNRFYTPLIGETNLSNCLAAISLAVQEHIEYSVIAKALSGISRIPGRMEFVEKGQEFRVVVDYAHTHEALRQLLITIRRLGPKRVILVFGCGGNRDRSKRPLMGRIGVRLADVVILTSDNPRNEDPVEIIKDIERGIPFWLRNRYRVIPDRKEAIHAAIKQAQSGDWVVIAGKGHETYQIVGNVFIPFDDRKVADDALNEIGKNG